MSSKRYTLEKDFPKEETFTDCSGTEREFVIDATKVGTKYFVTARERNNKADGYEFATSSTDPYAALGQLRSKIRKGSSTSYLTFERGKRSPSRDELQGRIGSRGVVVDGELVPFKEFVDMLQTYEGWQFSLSIVDPSDDL